MNVQGFKEKYIDEFGQFIEHDDLMEIDSTGTKYFDGVYSASITYIHHDSGKYYQVTSSWDDGFDPYLYSDYVAEVEPIIVKKTDWRVIEE